MAPRDSDEVQGDAGEDREVPPSVTRHKDAAWQQPSASAAVLCRNDGAVGEQATSRTRRAPVPRRRDNDGDTTGKKG
jgi:hypothetical protein